MDSREQTLEPLIGNAEQSFAVEEVSSGLNDPSFDSSKETALYNQSNYLELLPQDEISNVDSEVQELVFIDSTVTDSQTLIDSISGATEVIILDDSTDGLLQISDSLSQYRDVDAIHLVSHGDTGQLFLGNTKLSTDNLTEYVDVFADWSQSLAEDADIVLYGCDVASNEEGLAFLNEFSQLTDADVLASDDTTGSSLLHGDWDLEVAIGDVETGVIFNAEIAEAYQHTLYDSSFNLDLSLSYSDLFIETGVFEDNFGDYEFSYTDGTDLDFSFTDSDVEFSFTESDVDFDSVTFEDVNFEDNLTYEIYDTDGEVIIVETDFAAVDYSFVSNPDSFDFDNEFYLENNPDLASSGENPFLHYMQTGWKEGRDPSKFFDTSFYLDHNPDVRIAEMNPLEHYNTSGWKELRDPSAFFDTSHYLETYLDVLAADTNPLNHFQSSGWQEGRNPNQFFGTNYYLDQNPDVRISGMNPLDHYISSGATEGRNPSQFFNNDDYLNQNQDVAQSGLNPLEHFLLSGFEEGRSPNKVIETVKNTESVLVAPFDPDVSLNDYNFELFKDVALSVVDNPNNEVEVAAIPLIIPAGVTLIGITLLSAEVLRQANNIQQLLEENPDNIFWSPFKDPILKEFDRVDSFPDGNSEDFSSGTPPFDLGTVEDFDDITFFPTNNPLLRDIIEGSVLSNPIDSIFEQPFVSTIGNNNQDYLDVLMPNGSPIGVQGTGSLIRVYKGDINDALRIFDQVTQGGTTLSEQETTYPGIRIVLPNGSVGLRTHQTNSPDSEATINVDLPGVPYNRIKFVP